MSTAPTRVWLRAAALTALCAIVYATGLTSQGLVNWQESTRALVAREMQISGEWLAPTMRGEPYIAKPPMIYWAQIALASALGDEVGEWHLRMVVALAGTLGVLATFFVARRLFCDGLDPPDADRAAWWSALGLAVSILYVRSSRTGELDILLTPWTVLAIGAFHAAWVHAAARRRTHLGAVLLCAMCAAGAALTKGPPGVACVALAVLVAPLVWAAGERDVSRRFRAVGAGLGVLGVTAGVFALHRVHAGDLPGLALLQIAGAAAGWALSPLAHPGAAIAWLRTLARTHPVAVLGLPALALWLWGLYLERAFGAETVAALAVREVDNNLNALVPEAAERNLGFLMYGAAPIILATILGLAIIIRERPRPSRAVCTLTVWLIGGAIVFSVGGKGVARYLTPVWPACALLGGWCIMVLIGRVRDDAARRRWLGALSAVVLLAALAQAWWYGAGRAEYNSETSVRDLARELLATGYENLAAWQFDDPALDLYLGRTVPIFGQARASNPGERLAAHVLEHGPTVLLVREQTERVIERYGSAMDAFARAGLVAREVPVSAEYVRPPGRTRVLVFEVSLPD